jgi:PAS domain S-box-containing protein
MSSSDLSGGRLAANASMRYAAALMETGVAILGRWLLDPFLENYTPYILLYGAVAISAIYMGFGPSILAGVLGLLAANYFFVPPRGSFSLGIVQHLVATVTYLGVFTLITAAGEMSRRSTRKLNTAIQRLKHSEEELLAAHQELERRVQQRTIELRHPETKFRGLRESAPDGMVVVDHDGRIVLASAQVQKLFRYEQRELLGREIEVLLPKRFHSVHAEHRQGYFDGPHVRAMGANLELFALHKDVREIPVEISLSPLATENGLVVTAAIRDISERKRAEENLRILWPVAALVRDEERRRIARELHVSAGQILAALAMNLGSVEAEDGKMPPKMAKVKKDNLSLVDDLTSQLRTMSYLLHPHMLDEVGLSSALEWYADGLTERSKIKVKLQMPDHFGRLSPDLETAIFRIVQECLTNVHRHSGSSVASIHLSRSDNGIRLEVADRGKGMPPERLKDMDSGGKFGVGMRGMRERIRQLGGTLDIKSDRRGTTIVAELPAAGVSSTAAG